MPRKKANPEEAPETSEAAETEEIIPPEEEENFSLNGQSEEAEFEGDETVPEPDMANAPDFWSDMIEVAPASLMPETEPAKSTERAPTTPGLMAKSEDRRAFYELDFRELDRNLSEQERQEWNSIYASFRGHSVMTGKVAGVNPHNFQIMDRRTGKVTTQRFLCAVVIPFRVPILIPETELWFRGEERPRNVMKNIGRADIDFVITKLDRKKPFVVASRRLALASRRYYLSTQPQMNRPGSRLVCSILTVGNRQMLVNCHGYDITLTQRDLDYTAIPDLKVRYHRGEVLECIVKEYDSRKNHLKISVKEAIPNPFDGAEYRHPIGCSRQGLISGKYGGGVFVNLTDGLTVMCNYSFHYEDGDFQSGDSVTVVIQRFDYEKKQTFGKIVAKE